MDSITFLDKSELLKSIDDIRSDSSPSNWLIISHESDDHANLVLHSSGEGGIAELIENLSEDRVQYALLSLRHKIDLSEVVRFVIIHFMPNSIGLAESARFGRAYSLVQELLGQAHCTIEVGSKQDLSEEVIVSKISAAAGTNKNFYDINGAESLKQLKNYRYTPLLSPSSAKTPSPWNDAYPFVPDKTAKPLAVQAEDDLLEAISLMKKAPVPNSWVVCSYRSNDAKKPLFLVSSGAGGLASMKANFDPDSISYGLICLDTSSEGNKYTKFAFIRWIGSSVGAVAKAKACVQGNSVAEMFGDVHVEISASDPAEIDEDDILRKLSSRKTV